MHICRSFKKMGNFVGIVKQEIFGNFFFPDE